MRPLLMTTLLALALFVAPAGAAEPASPVASGVTVDYEQPLERLFDASLHALAVLKIPVQSREADAYTANILARRGVGSAKVTVTIVRTGELSCRVVVATSDHDPELPPLIHEKIAAALR
ncbi:MAG: hypothetical protein HQK87_11740 [Nitrospinae bacterium]|nr:hypothetical protein [Nitrospinota bacterium]